MSLDQRTIEEKYMHHPSGQYVYQTNDQLGEILGELYRRKLERELDRAHFTAFENALNSGASVDSESFLTTMSQWRLQNGGIAQPDNVARLLCDVLPRVVGQGPIHMDACLERKIFTYAALQVIDRPVDRAYCAFWAQNSVAHVAKTTYEVWVDNKLDSPDYIRLPNWIHGDHKESIKRSKWWQGFYAPAIIEHSRNLVEEWIRHSKRKSTVRRLLAEASK